MTVVLRCRGLGRIGRRYFVGKPATLGVGAVEHEELVAPRGDSALDPEEVRECWAVAVAGSVPVVPGVARIRGPLAGLAQTFERDSVAGVRLVHSAAERKFDLVALGRRGLSEHKNDRRHQGIAELNIVRVEPMCADERNAIREKALEGSAVVDVHELRRDEPSRRSRHPPSTPWRAAGSRRTDRLGR